MSATDIWVDEAAKKAKKRGWGSVEKDRQKHVQAMQTRSQEIRAELERVYGIKTDLPPRPEKEKKDRRKQQGFRSSTGEYGRWSSSPRRTS